MNFFNFPPLIDIYKKYLNDNLIDSEKKAYIISIFIEKYLKGKFYKEQKEDIKAQLKELIKYNILLTKLKKIHELIKKSFDKNITDINEVAFISDVKNYIKELKFDGYERISALNINIKRIIEIIKLLCQEKTFKCLVLSKEETTSILSYLYFMQKKKL